MGEFWSRPENPREGRDAERCPAPRCRPDPAALAELLLVFVDGLWLTCARLPEDADLAPQRAAVDSVVRALTG
ncbi:hypothetical protein GCM10009603_20430 [Nocardiopsis exhalans]